MALTEEEKYKRKAALLKKALEQADEMDVKDKAQTEKDVADTAEGRQSGGSREH